MMSRRFHEFVLGLGGTFTVLFLGSASPISAQSLGNAGTIQGTVADPSGAAVPSAQISLRNAVSGYNQSVQPGSDGTFKLVNIPPSAYHLEVTAPGFSTFAQEVEIRNSLPIQVRASLALAGGQTSVTVEGALDALETNRSQMLKIPASDPGPRLPDRAPGPRRARFHSVRTVGLRSLTGKMQLTVAPQLRE